MAEKLLLTGGQRDVKNSLFQMNEGINNNVGLLSCPLEKNE